jgi:hypothetical protein
MRLLSLQSYAIVIVLLARIQLPPAWSKHYLTRLSKRKAGEEYMADSLAEIHFLWKESPAIPTWHQLYLTIGLNLGVHCIMALVQLHTFCQAGLEEEMNTSKSSEV